MATSTSVDNKRLLKDRFTALKRCGRKKRMERKSLQKLFTIVDALFPE